MTETTPSSLVRRYYEQAWNSGEVDVVDDLVDGEIVLNGWSPPSLDTIKGIIAGTRESFPDLRYSIDDTIESGDKVVVRFAFSGTHLGEYRGIAPTNVEATYTGIGIWRVRDGKLVEHWSNIDLYGLMQQLGAIPA